MLSEPEWLASPDPTALLETVKGKVSDRKLRLFAVSCCRQIWHLMTDWRSRRAVEVAERYADGEATKEELGCANELSRQPWSIEEGNAEGAAYYASHESAALACERLSRPSLWQFADVNRATLLREVVGNPFQQYDLVIVVNDPQAYQKAMSIARCIYEDRAFEDMLVLADSLEDAGCDDEAILTHCRGVEECGCGGIILCHPDFGDYRCDKCYLGWRPLRSPHVRGCWVLDLILGKE